MSLHTAPALVARWIRASRPTTPATFGPGAPPWTSASFARGYDAVVIAREARVGLWLERNGRSPIIVSPARAWRAVARGERVWIAVSCDFGGVLP